MSDTRPKPTALVVDDDPAVRLLITDALSLYGFECDDAADAEDALTVLETYHPDICVSDIALPGDDGLALAQSIKRRWPEVLLVAVTGSVPHLGDGKILDAGYERCFRKPFDIIEFAQYCLGLCGR